MKAFSNRNGDAVYNDGSEDEEIVDGNNNPIESAPLGSAVTSFSINPRPEAVPRPVIWYNLQSHLSIKDGSDACVVSIELAIRDDTCTLTDGTKEARKDGFAPTGNRGDKMRLQTSET